VHAVIHSPQQAFSQQSSGAAASRSRSHSSATNSGGVLRCVLNSSTCFVCACSFRGFHKTAQNRPTYTHIQNEQTVSNYALSSFVQYQYTAQYTCTGTAHLSGLTREMSTKNICKTDRDDRSKPLPLPLQNTPAKYRKTLFFKIHSQNTHKRHRKSPQQQQNANTPQNTTQNTFANKTDSN